MHKEYFTEYMYIICFTKQSGKIVVRKNNRCIIATKDQHNNIDREEICTIYTFIAFICLSDQ